MKEYEEKRSAPEAKIQIENINFHIRITMNRYAKEENPIHKALLHTHLFYELFMCRQGEIRIKTEQREILLRAGDLAIIPPNQAHVLMQAAQNTEMYIILFLCKRIGGENNIDLYKKLTPIVNGEIHVLNNCSEFLLETEKIVGASFSENTDIFWNAVHFLELFLKIAMEKSNREEITELPHKKNGVVSNDIERMMKLDHMIANRYIQNYSASDYAKELFISTRQLDRITIKRYGKSFHQVILDRRIALAEQLLLTTDLTVETIALNAGFSSSVGLYKEFKKRRGVTPTAFRKQDRMQRKNE